MAATLCVVDPILTMRKTVLTIFYCLFILLSRSQNTDLPGPTPNLQTLPLGSYVIAMDNSLQVNSTGDFNLNAYGLLVYLLNNNVHLKWSIKAGKAKDGTDFTAMAEQIKPGLIAGGVSRNFKAGPFVIFASDTAGVGALIDAFYSSATLTGANRPQVYRLTAAASNVDIRYDLTGFRPKAAILTDGGNQAIHLAYMTTASIPSANYATSAGTDLLSNCFTFASEPHNTKTGTAVNNAISAIRDFVTKGGNFLAQCEAIDNYENNTLGRFQTTGGLTIANANVGTTLNYSNPDLSFSQYEGSYDASSGGSLKNWKFVGTTINNEHNHATGTGTNATVIGASVAKLYYDKGGLVFYVGNHSFTTSTSAGINGIRMYMNAFLTPSNTNCPELLFNPLSIKLVQFNADTKSGKTNLTWTLSGNEMVQQCSVEKSIDGSFFSPVRIVSSTSKSGQESYQFPDALSDSKKYYRIAIKDKQGKVQYSPIVSIGGGIQKQASLNVLDAADRDGLLVSYFSPQNDVVKLRLYTASGSMIYSEAFKIVEGTNILFIPSNAAKSNKLYFIETVNGNDVSIKAKVFKL